MGTQIPQKGTQPPICGPCLLWPNGWMDQLISHLVQRQAVRRLGPSHNVLDGDPAPPKRRHFSAHVYCSQTAGWITMPLDTKVLGKSRPRPHYVRWGPAHPPGRGTAAPRLFGPCLLWSNGHLSQLLLSSCQIADSGRLGYWALWMKIFVEQMSLEVTLERNELH